MVLRPIDGLPEGTRKGAFWLCYNMNMEADNSFRGYNPSILPRTVEAVIERVQQIAKSIGGLSMLPSETDPTHLKRGAAQMLDDALDQPQLDFGE